MLGQQGDVLLCYAPVPPYTVKAAYQHHIHLSGKNGLRQLLQSRTVKGQSRAMLGGNTNDGVPGLFRITTELGDLLFQGKAKGPQSQAPATRPQSPALRGFPRF